LKSKQTPEHENNNKESMNIESLKSVREEDKFLKHFIYESFVKNSQTMKKLFCCVV